MTVDAQTIPENLVLLHHGENDIRGQSLVAIVENSDLLLHVKMIERTMDTLQFYRIHYDEDEQEQITVKLLGARIFNSVAAGFGLASRGYYQASAMHTRDILETTFLLDYFSTDPALISKWAEATDEVRKKEFGQAKIRTALDKRDGYTSKKRHEHYQMLCNLAAHPTPQGLGLLRPNPIDLAIMGPYYSGFWLTASIEELVKVCMLASDVFVQFFPAKNPIHMQTAMARVEEHAIWFKRIFGVNKDKEVADMKKYVDAQSKTDGGTWSNFKNTGIQVLSKDFPPKRGT